jgi:hypothetical protein
LENRKFLSKKLFHFRKTDAICLRDLIEAENIDIDPVRNQDAIAFPSHRDVLSLALGVVYRKPGVYQ